MPVVMTVPNGTCPTQLPSILEEPERWSRVQVLGQYSTHLNPDTFLIPEI